VPTIRFQVLYVFLVLAHDRRRILHFNVTCASPKLRSTFEINKMQKRLCNMCPAGAVMGQDEVFARHSRRGRSSRCLLPIFTELFQRLL
jgi:hypothetical protein